ncbi:hypothetical protein FA95DRAFT_1565175 [Auriscalpium vulgare]|uniref:Uncharacterized protein n=1 Tax=Auriscalpium vulgare TaxID=40419 RepID=A0ACB8RDI1_9AGAM|nr:hypothetical protein FA95DRAFT_1565175 [Auriscalpium vulgare]
MSVQHDLDCFSVDDLPQLVQSQLAPESSKGDADGETVFVRPFTSADRASLIRPILKTGLSSANVAAFIIDSYKQLSADRGDTSVALLTLLTITLSNGTRLPLKPCCPTSRCPPSFRVHALS